MRSFFFLLFPLTLMAAPFKGSAPDSWEKIALEKITSSVSSKESLFETKVKVALGLRFGSKEAY